MGIQESLEKLFEDHKVVFWYDAEQSMHEQYQALDLNNVERIKVANNEFEIKHKIISSKKNAKYLLYFPYAEPAYTDNWLLDLQLAHREFNTDQEAMFLQEMGLNYDLKYLVRDHIEFFKSKERRGKLLDLIADDESESDIKFKMLAVVFRSNYPTVEAYIQSYATSFINGNNKIERDLDKYNLGKLFWDAIARKFDYRNESSNIYDFLIDTFSRNFSPTNNGRSVKETRILLSLWKDAISNQDAFKQVSNKIAEDIQVTRKLESLQYQDILNDDLFRIIDLKIISDLCDLLIRDAISSDDLSSSCKQRKNKYWYPEYVHFYEAISHASALLSSIKKLSAVDFESIEESCSMYADSLYEVDYHYRKFLLHYRSTQQNRVLDALKDKVCRSYTNDWLAIVNTRVQDIIDNNSKWVQSSSYSQSKFYKKYVERYVKKPQRLFVLISDALRYENGHQLVNELQTENRYEAEIDYMITGLPCYTQLGMASLLPHDQLNIHPKDCSVLVDGMNSAGTQARSKILSTNTGVRATAITAENFLKLNSATDGRKFAKDHDLIYIYNNRIDKTGDDKMTEDRVFEAVEEEITYIKEIIKRVSNVNGNHIVITSDHGYLYQHEVLESSDFSESKVTGDVWKENRRFILGSNLSSSKAMHKFNGTELGLDSNTDVLITKNINRLRVKGAGSRFVHGGASLQEIVVPVIKVAKKREDTTSYVDVDIIKSTDKITTNILAVSFLQKELVSDKVLPRTIRASIQAEDGSMISDIFNYVFDATEGSERQREVKHRFQLSSIASGKYKNQRVSLVLEEPINNSSNWKEYESYYYTLNISFTNDFDDI